MVQLQQKIYDSKLSHSLLSVMFTDDTTPLSLRNKHLVVVTDELSKKDDVIHKHWRASRTYDMELPI